MPPDGPIFPTLSQLIYEENYQTDVPHMLHFALVGNNKDPNIVKDPDCRGKDTNECRAHQFYGVWPNIPVTQDSDAYTRNVEELVPEISLKPPLFRQLLVSAMAYYTTKIEMLMLCPKPHIYNSGSHRVMMMLWYNGERYVLAVEEGHGKQPLFIQALTPGGKVKLAEYKEYAIEILGAALNKAIGAKLYSNRFDIHVYGDDKNLLQEGCSPSPYMSEY